MSGAHPAVEVVGELPSGVARLRLCRVVEQTLELLRLPRASVCVKVASDATVRRYNRRFRGVDRTTDVLSFPAADEVADGIALGDVLISRDRARVQARAAGLTLGREMEELALHGVLHLVGHDHEADDGEMDALELRLRRRILDAPRRRTHAALSGRA